MRWSLDPRDKPEDDTPMILANGIAAVMPA
jgi:hypothetical protein